LAAHVAAYSNHSAASGSIATEEVHGPGCHHPNGSRRNEDIALDLLKFVAATTGVIKATSAAAGFVAASGAKPEDQVNQLLALYTKCLGVVQGK
jgi:hypothetical protein